MLRAPSAPPWGAASSDRIPLPLGGTVKPDPRSAMSKVRFALTTLALGALPLVLAFAPRADKVTFAPKDDSEVAREFSFKAAVYLDDLRVMVDGQEMPVPTDELSGGILFDVAMEVADRFVKSDEGRVIELVRTYGKIRGEAGPEGETESMDGIDELVDKPVRFRWNESDGEYDVTYADEKAAGKPELLEALAPDMDFTMLLPEGEVAKGAKWSVKGDELALLFFPGGMPVSLPDDPSGMSKQVEEALESQVAAAFKDFEVACTYQGAREEGSTRVGEITFSFQGKVNIDLTDILRTAIEAQAGEVDIQVDITANLGLEFDGSGILLWNLAAGHVHSMDMTNEMVLALQAEADVDAMGQQFSGEISLEASVNAKSNLTTR